MPLLYLNLAALVIGALWLGFLSQWQVIGLGALMVVLSPYVIPLLLIPAGIFSHFMALYRTQKRRGPEQTLFVLSLVYILLFLTFWSMGVFDYVVQHVRPEARAAAVLWADCVALTPLFLWITRDRENIFMMTLIEAAQIGILIPSVLCLWRDITSFWVLFAAFGTFMAAVMAAQAIYEEKVSNKTGSAAR